MVKLQQLARKAITNNKMFDGCENVIVALSGGADSVALLHFLLNIRETFNIKVMAAHVNHNLRGKEADGDEAFVRKLCKENNVKLFVKSIDINKLAKEQKISTELCGRNERYNFFEELSEARSAKIATAHSASDNAETVIFNLTRGSGLKGITGIQPVRDYIIRPLIYCTRQDVEDYCQEFSLEYVTDSSNLTDDYTRNKIRHNVVPVLKEINPALENTISRSAQLFESINDYISQQAEQAISEAKLDYGYDATYLNNLHPALKNYVIFKICQDENIDVESTHIQLVADIINKTGAVNLSGNKTALVKQNVFRIISKNEENTDFSIKFSNNIEFEFKNKKYKVTDRKSGDIKLDLSEKNLFFRTRKSGDMFTIPHRNVTKSVKKLFNECKIPAELRDTLLVLTDGNIIYWIESIGVSKQGLSSDKSGMIITVEKEK